MSRRCFSDKTSSEIPPAKTVEEMIQDQIKRDEADFLPGLKQDRK